MDAHDLCLPGWNEILAYKCHGGESCLVKKYMYMLSEIYNILITTIFINQRRTRTKGSCFPTSLP